LPLLSQIVLAAAGAGKGPPLRRAEISSAPGLQLVGELGLGASVALLLPPTTNQAGALLASRVVAIAARPHLAFETGAAPPGVDLTLEAAPIVASGGAPGVAATVAVVAGPGVAAAGAPEMVADAVAAKARLAAITGHPEVAASALIASIPGVTVTPSAGGASPFTFLDGTIWNDGTPWIDD